MLNYCFQFLQMFSFSIEYFQICISPHLLECLWCLLKMLLNGLIDRLKDCHNAIMVVTERAHCSIVDRKIERKIDR